MTQESFKLQKRALLLDFACIAVALVSLYLANKDLVPLWVLITGASIATVLLVTSIILLIKSRKIERAALKAENDAAMEQLMETDLTSKENTEQE